MDSDEKTQLTPQEAADLLNVSSEYLAKLLDVGKLRCAKTVNGPRLQLEDVLAFREKRDQERSKGLAELSRLSQEFGGYDDEL